MATATGYLPPLNSREEFVDHLEGYTEPTVEELEDGKLNRKLLKTYMLETARHSSATPGMDSLFPKHVHLRRLDDPESASDDLRALCRCRPETSHEQASHRRVHHVAWTNQSSRCGY